MCGADDTFMHYFSRITSLVSSVGGWILLKWILKAKGVRILTGFNWFRNGSDKDFL
jgi:hypothetical protein